MNQGDVWEPRKLAHARKIVTQNEVPTLFHCRQLLIYSNNRLLRL